MTYSGAKQRREAHLHLIGTVDKKGFVVSDFSLFQLMLKTEMSAKKVVLQGLDGYIVSEKNSRFLVCKRSEE